MCLHRDLIICIQRCLITHMYRDSIIYAFKELHHTLYTQGPISMHLGNYTPTHVLTGTPSCMYLGNSITHVFSHGLVFPNSVIKYPDINNLKEKGFV